jgi:hypothetical protein
MKPGFHVVLADRAVVAAKITEQVIEPGLAMLVEPAALPLNPAQLCSPVKRPGQLVIDHGKPPGAPANPEAEQAHDH